MALIVKCRSCYRRVPDEATACPACGSTAMRFVVDYWPTGRGGRRVRLVLSDSFASVAAARKVEKSLMTVNRKPTVAAASSASTVADLFGDYLKWYKLHRAETTCTDVSGAWERDLKRILGGYVVGQIDATHFSIYQQMRGGVSNRTINKELDYFSGFLRWCRREKRIPIERIEYDKLPCSRPLPIILSPEEVVRILAAAEQEPVYHALLLCLYTMGLRISEARGMKVEDFDFENANCRVRQKGGSWKLLPINGHVTESVKKLIELRGVKAGQHVFSVRKKGAPLQNIRKAIQRICKRAEVEKKVNPHLFRHSIATHLLGADVNLRTIQHYLGHKESTTTEFYTHVAMAHLRSAQDMVVSTRKANNSG